jgi:hypothetical protein
MRGGGIEGGVGMGGAHGAGGALGLVQLQWTPVVISGVDIEITTGTGV